MATISSTGTISSAGIGSGLDINGIVTQLVAVEKAPLQQLQKKASTIQSQLSEYGQLKSQLANLSDAATKLASASRWNQMAATSSDATSVSAASSTGSTQAANLSIQVQKLATPQSLASVALPANQGVGTGTLVIQTGSWDATGTQFTPGSGTPVSIEIADGANTPADIAAKINASAAGITATTITDATGTRLLLNGNATGQSSGFQLTTTDAPGAAPGLGRLAYPPVPASSGMSAMQQASDAQATINGIAITSASNQLDGVVSGVSMTLNKVTTAPVSVTIKPDNAARRGMINDFLTAYNAINKTLTADTAYDAATKTAGVLQGDRAAIGIQAALRSVLQGALSSGTFTRLTDVGISQARDGSLSVDESKMTSAMNSGNDLGKLFNAAGTAGVSDGIATRLAKLANDMTNFDGKLTNRTNALQQAVKSNSSDQQKVTDHAALVEARLRKQYSALDKTMSSMTALSNYVSQQVTNWNKSNGN